MEQITEQLQQERQERLKRGTPSEAASSEFPSAPPSTTDDDNRSFTSIQGSYIHASQVAHSTLEVGGSTPRTKRSKAQLWQDMKINSITRALSLIYTLCLLTLLTRIQLNLLGRRTYLSSVIALATPPNPSQSSTISLENKDDDNYDNVYGNDFETNRKYLTFSWWLLHRGSKMIVDRVMAAVKEVFGQVNIREDISLEYLAKLIMDVRRKVEGATEEERRTTKWLHYLLPSREDEVMVIKQSGMSESDDSPSPEARPVPDPMVSAGEDQAGSEELINASLRRLLDETSDLADSPTFAYVLTHLLDAAFSQLVDFHVAIEAYKMTGPTAPGVMEPRITEIVDRKCKLAHVLPVFCKQAHAIAMGSGDLDAIAGVAAQEALGNEYLAAIDHVHDLEAFAAVIYSSHFDYELSDSPGAAAPSTSHPPTAPSGLTPDGGADEWSNVDNPIASKSASDRVLDEGEVIVLSNDPQEGASAETAPPNSFESAWQKATSTKENGQ